MRIIRLERLMDCSKESNTYQRRDRVSSNRRLTFLSTQGENKIVDLEEELRQIGENLKALEVAEEKAQQREEEFKRQIRVLSDRLKLAETR